MKAQSVHTLVAVFLLLCSIVLGCGVKSAPTPMLPSSPGELQQEAENRALQRREKAKEKEKEKEQEKEKSTGAEKSVK